MNELFTKYLNDQCSPGEVEELLTHFNVPGDEAKLRELINESLKNADADDDGSQWKFATDESFAAIKNRMSTEKVKVVPLTQRKWFRVAAVIVLLVGGYAVYDLINDTNQKNDIVKTDPSKQDPPPGNNKAILTLADGSTIVLESVAKGTVGQQGDSKIVKQAEGQIVYEPLHKNTTGVLLNSITTPRGGHYGVTLSDGSKVWLNAASSIRFPAAFSGSERRVTLTGEAYFEVVKNTAMPFNVAIDGKGEVKVLGTHFNVNAYPDEPTISTTLLEGSVKLTGLSKEDSQTLKPGEQARLHRNGQISIDKNADIEQAMAWKNGAFNFNNADLEVVFRELSRWYDVAVKFEGPIQARQFSGEIQRDLKLSQVLKLLENNNVFCRLEDKTLVVLKQ